MAAALSLLILLPALATDGLDIVRTTANDSLTVAVFDSVQFNPAIHDFAADNPNYLGVDSNNIHFLNPRDTKLGPTLYVSSDEMAYDTVYIVVEKPANPGEIDHDDDPSTDEIEGLRIQLDSDRSSPKTLVLRKTADQGFVYHGKFQVIGPLSGGTAGADQIEAFHGDVVTVTSDDNTARLTVDGNGPVFSDITPEHETLQTFSTAIIGFTVTDTDSGLRTDREAGTDLDGDDRLDEPLSKDNLGDSADVDVSWLARFGDAREIDGLERRGDRNWVELERDHSYSVSFIHGVLTSGTYEWRIQAYDRVGNRTWSDSEGAPGIQKHMLTVDALSPEIAAVHAGIGFDSTEGKEVQDSSSLLIVFENEGEEGEGNEPSYPLGMVDPLDRSSIQAADFKVAGHEVARVIHPNRKKSLDEMGSFSSTQDDTAAYQDDVCESHTGLDQYPVSNPSGCIDTRNRVYVVLTAPMADDATAEVQIIGGAVLDLAGNGNLSFQGVAADRIPPTLAVAAAGDVSTDGRPLGREAVTLSVASGERLAAPPKAWLVSFDQESKISGVEAVGLLVDGANAWDASIDGDNDTKVAALIVRGEDLRDNVSTTPGWTDDDGDETADPEDGNGSPDVGEAIDLAKLDAAGLTVEFDNDIAPADLAITPRAGSSLRTDSPNPFIQLTFAEGAENTITVEANAAATPPIVESTHDSYTAEDGEETDFDSYGTVTITAVTVDGENAMSDLVRTGDAEFSLGLRGLALGQHTLAYTAVDEAGNEITVDDAGFVVLARIPYEVSLRRGFNLISLPKTPEDPSIGSVLPPGHPATAVLTYRAGEWTAAFRDETTGEWDGTLTEIVAGYGYWIETPSSTSLSTVIVEPAPGSVLPTFPVTSGWNLLGIVDVDRGEAGVTKRPVSKYLASVAWPFAYGFDNQTNSWEKLTNAPDGGDVVNGSGYWVWIEEPGLLVP